MLKYPPGTKLICLVDMTEDIGVGEIVTICESTKYPDAYAFEELIEYDDLEITDPGWTDTFVENPEIFKIGGIPKWKKFIEKGKVF